jgi:hypothetical protein
MRIRIAAMLAWVAVVATVAGPAPGRIKLATLPKRERVEIQLDNGRYTLVEEERIVPLLQSSAKTGNNKIDFSWSNTRINKDSIQFRPLGIRDGDTFRPIKKVRGSEEVSVVNVAFPPGENALVWEVYAAKACAVKVRVSYLIDNLTRTFNYRALANKDETELVFRKFIRLRNYSGEDFGTAGVWAGFGPKFFKEVGQQEEIEMLIRRFPKVSVEKTFTFDWYAHGKLNVDKPLASPILTHYQLINDKKHGLGEFPLQPGKARVFIEDGRGGQAFLGEDWAKLTPLDGKMRLYLGQSRDIVCTRIIEKNKRHSVRGNLFHQELILRYEIENFRKKPATLDIVDQLNRVAAEYGRSPHGDVEWEFGRETSKEIKFTYENGNAAPVLHVKLPARPAAKDEKVEKTIVRFHFTIQNLW